MNVPPTPAALDARGAASRPAAVALALASLALPGCSGEDGPTPPPGDGPDPVRAVAVQEVVSGLRAPTFVTAPRGDDRLFVAERSGRIRIARNGRVLDVPFLDIRSAVEDGGNEQGLLGMAFDPDFEGTGRFYVDFTRQPDGATRVVRYTVSDDDPDRADPASADTLLRVDQPARNHNGGMLAFGPDGMLYVALGDGGGAGDPGENGQDSTTVLGSLVRLDPSAGPSFTPGDNPFRGREGNDLLWAYGLRNPWRFSFDQPSATLFVADVGQNEREEVNAASDGEAGINYGWDVMEGSACFEPAQGCDEAGLRLPVLDYTHGPGCSVTGGYVYRGSEIPAVVGRYFFSDFCAGFLRSFRLEDGDLVDVVTHDVRDLGSVTSFGTGGDGELYLVTAGGRLFRMVER